MNQTDITIIGAGPSGLFAAFQAGMLGIKTHIIDVLDVAGGQCSALYPEKPIYDIPAFPKISGGDLIANLLEQIKPFNPTFHLGQQVVSLKQNNDNFIIGTSTETNVHSKAIIIAVGSGAFVHKKPPLEDIEKYEGKSIFYTIQNPKIFTGKKIAIAGGGDSAADWAVLLSDIAEKIYLIHRRDNLRCLPDSAEKIEKLVKSGKIEKLIPYQLKNIIGNNGFIEKLNLYDLNEIEKSIEIDYLLPFFGLSTELGVIADWGLDLDKKTIKVEQSTMRTNIKGIYAIGDIATYPNKLKLILTGFSEAASAMHDAYNIIFPDKPLHFEYSTSSNKLK